MIANLLNKNVEVKIPPGVDNGTRLRVRSEGDAGINGGPSGDLYVDILVKDHPFFKREEENIMCEVPISIPQAVLGGKIDIPTLEGKSELKIPPGVQPGQMMRLKGKGIKSLNSNSHGDLYVKLELVIPKLDINVCFFSSIPSSSINSFAVFWLLNSA